MKKILLVVMGILILAGGINLQDGIAQSITISGSVTSGGSPLPGVTISGLPENPVTDLNGYYSVEVPPGWSGTVKPKKIGHAIHPATKVYTNVTSSRMENYTYTVLPKMALVLDKPTATYDVGEPIMVTLTIQNKANDVITTQGFGSKDFSLRLRFTDPDDKLITANLPDGAVLPTPPPPPVIGTPGAEPITGDYIEIVPQGWVWSLKFNVLNSYTLTKAGNYSVKANFSMSDYLNYYETAPGSGIFYSPLESGSSGDVESNVLNFTLLPSLDHISISPSTSTITAGNSQSYTVIAYDSSNNSLGDVTSGTTFTISPDGSCSNTNCLATVAGPHSVMASYSGKTDVATLQVNPGSLNSISISPSSATITVSGSQTYTATGYDQYNNSLGDVTPVTNFSISPDGSCTGATCAATVLGTHTVTGNVGGKTAQANLSVVVYTFTGFFSPVDNLPIFNSVRAGQAVPVKFSLNGNQRLKIFATGYPTSGTIVCTPGALVDTIEETVTAGGSSLSYDPVSDLYTYVWKTDKAWVNTCRQLVIKFLDGTYQRANFKFTR